VKWLIYPLIGVIIVVFLAWLAGVIALYLLNAYIMDLRMMSRRNGKRSTTAEDKHKD